MVLHVLVELSVIGLCCGIISLRNHLTTRITRRIVAHLNVFC